MCRSDRCGDPVGTGGRKPRPDHALSFASRAASLGAPHSAAFFSKAQGLRFRLDQLPVVLLGSLHDTLPRCPPSAEGGHKRAVLAAQHDYVWVRLVYVVVEVGEHLHLHAHLLRTSPFPKGGQTAAFSSLHLRECVEVTFSEVRAEHWSNTHANLGVVGTPERLARRISQQATSLIFIW